MSGSLSCLLHIYAVWLNISRAINGAVVAAIRSCSMFMAIQKEVHIRCEVWSSLPCDSLWTIKCIELLVSWLISQILWGIGFIWRPYGFSFNFSALSLHFYLLKIWIWFGNKKTCFAATLRNDGNLICMTSMAVIM